MNECFAERKLFGLFFRAPAVVVKLSRLKNFMSLKAEVEAADPAIF